MSEWGEWEERLRPHALAEYLYARRSVPLPTGTPLDSVLGGGLMPGVTVLGGAASAGKSAIACDCAQHVAAGGGRVLYLTLDDSRASVLKRCASAWSCSDEAKALGCAPVQWGRVDAMVAEEIGEAADPSRAAWRASQRPGTACRLLACFEDACPGLLVEDSLTSAPAVCAAVRRMADEGEPPALVVVDYVQQYLTGDAQVDSQEYARVGAVTAQLQRLALDLSLPVLELSSLRKLSRAERDDPQLDWLRGNGSVGYAAWAAAVITRDEELDGKGFRGIRVNVLKNKAGRAGFYKRALLYGPYSSARALKEVKRGDS